MTPSGVQPRRPLPPSGRLVLGSFLAASGLAGAAGFAAVAWTNHPRELEALGESALLVTLGKGCGLVAAFALVVQFLLGLKLRPLDRVFGLHRLLWFHRGLGVAAVSLATLHPLLVFAPKGVEIGPVRTEIWPEILGALLLVGLWTAVLTGHRREFLGLPYERWFGMHRLGTASAAVLLAIHAYTANAPASAAPPDLTQGIPRWGFVAVSVALGALLFWARVIRPARAPRFGVRSVTPVGRNTHAVEVADGAGFAYAPGQFAFVTFLSSKLPRERHPWTITSTPTRPAGLIFTIKGSGDFTRQIGDLRPGDRAIVEGPYGLFSHLAYAGDEELVFLAGGVGATPMLSMLRHLQDMNDRRRVTLVWGNRTEADILCREELDAIQRDLPGLRVHHVLSEQGDFHGRVGLLDRALLGEVLEAVSREAHVFVCGPPPMMDSAVESLRGLGFRPRRIHTERFSF